MVKKRCQFCGKLCRQRVREFAKQWSQRKFCSNHCAAKARCISRGFNNWTDKKLTKYFWKHFERKGRINTKWPINYKSAVADHFGSWSKFLHKMEIDPYHDTFVSKPKKTARKILSYLEKEQDIKKGEKFELNLHSIVGYDDSGTIGTVWSALNLLRKNGKIKRAGLGDKYTGRGQYRSYRYYIPK